MPGFIVQIFASDLLEVARHYERAFGATVLNEAMGDGGELIHIELDIMGARLCVAPKRPDDITKGNTVQLCLKFGGEDELRYTYGVLEEGGSGEGLRTHLWSNLEGYVTDKFGVMWCIGI